MQYVRLHISRMPTFRPNQTTNETMSAKFAKTSIFEQYEPANFGSQLFAQTLKEIPPGWKPP